MLVRMKWYLIMVVICISFTANGVEHLSLFTGHLCIFIEEMAIQIFCPFFLAGLFVLLSSKKSLYVLDPLLLSDK